jgi:hypothetical protein
VNIKSGLILIGCLLGLGLATPKANAQQSVEATWDPDPSGLVTGYRLFYGTKSGVYTNSIVFSDVNDVEIDGLQGGVTYYFAVQSTDQQGDVSPLSNEASYSVAILQPVALQLVTFPGSKSLYIEGDVNPPGPWNLYSSPDMTHWTLLDFGDNDSAEVAHIYDTSQAPHMFFKIVRY